MRKMKVGKTGFEEAYRAVREYRDRYPEKAVTFFSQQYPAYGWAILMAGGSLPNVPLTSHSSPLNSQLLQDLCQMKAMEADGCIALGDSQKGYLIYSTQTSIPVVRGKYQLCGIDLKTGDIKVIQKSLKLQDSFRPDSSKKDVIYWLRRL
jgi:hypothetical protein